MRKAGVTLRWDELSVLENDGEPVDPEKKFIDVSYWLKGTFYVGYSEKHVTSVQGNGKFLLQWSVLRNDF